MQGYAIEHDKPFTYRKSFTVPADYAGKHTILRFDGVYSHARLFVNGTFVREHHGGFTRWETDVTPFVLQQPGCRRGGSCLYADRPVRQTLSVGAIPVPPGRGREHE